MQEHEYYERLIAYLCNADERRKIHPMMDDRPEDWTTIGDLLWMVRESMDRAIAMTVRFPVGPSYGG